MNENNDQEIKEQDEEKVEQSTTMGTTGWIYFGILFSFTLIGAIFFIPSFFQKNSNPFKRQYQAARRYKNMTS